MSKRNNTPPNDKAQLRETQELCTLALRATNDRIWDWDIQSGHLAWIDPVDSRLGYGRDQVEPTLQWWLDHIHPEDRAAIREHIRKIEAGGVDQFTAEYRCLKADGDYADICNRGYIVHDSAGLPVRGVGAMQDITPRKQAEKRLRQSEARSRKTLDHIPQMVWSTFPDGTHDYSNRLWDEFTGVAPGTTDGETWKALTHPDDQARAQELWSHSLRTGEPYEIQYRLRHVSGEYRWVLARAWPERGFEGRINRWYGTCTDIHDRVVAQHELHESQSLQQGVLDASGDCIMILSPSGVLEFMNEPGCRALGLDDFADVCGKAWTSLWPKDGRAAAKAAVDEALASQPSRFTGYCPTASGTPKWWDVVVSPMFDEQGLVTRLLAVSRDVTTLRETSERLKWASEHDALTSLPNRRSFQAHLQAASLRAIEQKTLLGVLLIDLDHFKHVNDSFGHATGDHLLQTFGERLKGAIRTDDFVARLGGDEFAVILENVEDERTLIDAGASMLARLNEPVHIGGRVISGGASIGGAIFPTDASTASELLKNADTALYARKALGRGGIKMFRGHMRADAQRVALDETTVIPHYQPKVELKSGRVSGFEALLRWQHPSEGLQEPDTVAEAFNDFELASKIGELMQTKVFADISKWLRHGISVGNVSFNAAPAEFLRDDFAERLLCRLQEHSVPPALIEVEVTEHVFVERSSVLVGRALGLLKKAGVRVALDDFGTGHSSLAHLRDFPVDVVKIDQSFVRQMVDNPQMAAIVRAVVNLADSLSLQVVAEGVETAEQVDLLKLAGCSHGQGWFFGRPVEGAEISRLMGKAA